MQLWIRFAVAAGLSAMPSIALVMEGGAPVAALTTCANLVGFPLSGGTITSATDITAPFTTPASSGSAAGRLRRGEFEPRTLCDERELGERPS
jgi:hypothetical protein